MIQLNRRKRLVAGAAAVVTAALLTACSSSGGSSTASSAPAGTPQSGGDFTFAENLYPPCLDVSLNGGRASTVENQIIDYLIVQQPGTNALKPDLATSWKVSNNSSTYTFQLKQGVTFSDGTPFDAQVVKDNLDTLVAFNKDAKTDTLVRSALREYVSSKVLGQYEVQVNFSGPSLGFLQDVSQPYLAIVSESTLKETYAQRCAGQLIGTGPFVISKVVPNESVTLVPRKGYGWAPPTATHTGEPYLSQITYQYIPEDATRVGGLESGQFNGIDVVPVNNQSQLTADGEQLVLGQMPGLVPGLRQNPFSPFGGDAAVREAIQLGINRPQLNQELYGGKYKLVSSAASASTPDYVDLSSDLAYDPTKAKALLEADGWKVGPGGIRVKNGVKLEPKIEFTPGSTAGATEQDLELIQEQLQAIGVYVQLDPTTAAQFTVNYANMAKSPSPYDFLTGSGPSTDPGFLVGLFENTNPALGGARQPQLQSAAEALGAAATPAAFKAKSAALQELLVSQGYWIPVREQTISVSLASDVAGFSLDAYAEPYFYDTWLKAGS